MSDLAVRAEGLSKRYAIGERRAFRRDLRSAVVESAQAVARHAKDIALGRPIARRQREHVWALQDVGFEIRRGEIVGIIGRNGAGKSTLLKVLSRITEPTTGYAEIHGRIAALLEVGTGFHPELTGRENVYLNGTILGMRQREIARKFDEIVDFAGVERFIDTPVKHYSSGMHLRLAFSVAAHLEPEIVLIDEVLAVGDAEFQRKCLNKISDVAAQGRTVIFVSHNLAVVKELCESSIVLADGRVEARGSVAEGLAHYSRVLLDGGADPRVSGRRWQGIRVNGGESGASVVMPVGAPFVTEAVLNLDHDHDEVKLLCLVYDAAGNLVLDRAADFDDCSAVRLGRGRYHLRIHFPPVWLAPGIYTVFLKLTGLKPGMKRVSDRSDALVIDVTGATKEISRGLLSPPLRWELEEMGTFEHQVVNA